MTTPNLQQPVEERMGAWKARRRRYHVISTLWSVLFIFPVVCLGTYFAIILVDAAGPLLSGEVGYGHPEYFGRQSYVNTHSVLLGACIAALGLFCIFYIPWCLRAGRDRKPRM
ncbi:hypothetical protein [Pseudarthrobacter sp. NamE5]|uniref:hypothetical protein n=1 Tax=Pseudarthrobacter sp. NamE5 TaxID=2576839 RepID=UPI00110AE33E|nr:hypothetical protein [Pseudarthrobacter sp. NamE5]TLM87661.1 hypothetical protein FDW84_03475 [Pseudarthrobacter sp. NamE5]